MSTSHFGRLVRDKREEKGYTVREGAEMCGLSTQSLTGIEYGDTNPRLSNVLNIGVAFDIDLGDLNACKPEGVVQMPPIKGHKHYVATPKYIVTRTTYLGETIHTSYGIAAVEESNGDWIILQTIPDITTDISQARYLARRCTSGELDPIHLRDVVEDFLDSY